MITDLRSGLKNGSMSYIIWIAIASMLLGYIVPIFFKQDNKKGKAPWAIRVNKCSIPYQTFALEIDSTRKYISLLRSHYGQFADYILQNAGITDARSMAFRTLVTQELMRQALASYTLLPHHDYITHKMSDAEFVQRHAADLIPQQFIAADGTVNGKMLKDYLRRSGMSIQDFEDKIATKVGMWTLSHAIDLFSYAPSYELEHAVAQKHSKKGFVYIRLPYQDFVEEQKKHELTQQDLTAFFEKENLRIKRYEVSEKRTGTQWEFSPDTYGITVDQKAIESYYEQNKAKEFVAAPSTMHIRQIVFNISNGDRTSAYQKASEIHALVMHDQSTFADNARTHSDDKQSAAKGGLLEPFVRGTNDRLLERAAFSLQQDGEVSPIIELADRLIIIQRVHKEPQTYKSFKDVRSTIEQKVRINIFKESFNNDAKTLLETQAESAYGLFKKEHQGRSKNLSDIARSDDPMARAIFSLTPGSYASYIEGSNGYIVRLNTIEPGYTPSLDDVATEVKQDLIAQRARNAFDKAGNRLLSAVAGHSIDTVASDEGIRTHAIEPFSIGDGERINKVRANDIDPMKLLALEHVGSTSMEKRDNAIYIIQCVTIKAPDSIEDSQKQDAYKDTMQQKSTSFFEGYIASLYRDATIETNGVVDILEDENSI